nr:retrovirus-related Pol polyprotein from transposon TNT 1-94 [Tanacetum cinerariifolium]
MGRAVGTIVQFVYAGAIYCTKVYTEVCACVIYPNKVVSRASYDKQWQKTKGHFQNQCSKLVASRDKEVNMATRDSDEALVCCIKNTVKNRIMDSGASFYATYCKEELDRFRLHFGKVRLADDKTLDIVGIRDAFLKTSFGKN